MSSGVNIFTNNLKISDTTKTECVELIFFQRSQKIVKKNTAVQIYAVFRTL